MIVSFAMIEVGAALNSMNILFFITNQPIAVKRKSLLKNAFEESYLACVYNEVQTKRNDTAKQAAMLPP